MAQTFRIRDGDVRISHSTGRPVMVTGTPKTRQDIREMLLVDVQPSGFGTGLSSLVGTTPPSSAMLTHMVRMRIMDSIRALQRLRGRRRGAHGPEEVVVGVDRLSVSRRLDNPKAVSFSLNVRTAAGVLPPIAGTLEG